MKLAPLSNMQLCHEALLRSIERPDHLPGIVTFSGFSGLGKTCGASYTTAETNAVFVRAYSTSTVKSFLITMLKELGEDPVKTNAEMTEQVGEALAMADRPLIIDETDHIVVKKYVELIRDIYEIAQVPILLIGEEHMPGKLQEWERFHNRILAQIQAVPASVKDAMLLRELHCGEIDISEALVEHFRRECNGVVRRICVNLEEAKQAALKSGTTSFGVEEWGGRPVYTGRPPIREKAAKAA